MLSHSIILSLGLIVVGLGQTAGLADDAVDQDKLGKTTAVALNYCRATFHRIQKYPSKRVLVEEQEKILNNLNLNQIADEEVVRLYMAVLQEIDEMRIEEKERRVIRDTHHRVLYRQLAIHALHGATQVASMQYVEAVKTGAKSWWDYRTMAFNSELDTWRLEKGRVISLSEKTSQFLDTFWKLARKRSIPDHWLVRRNNLDDLEKAMRETNLQVRLRILQRMEHFMECYPPYWYYVGRTQQALGQLFAASETYKKLQDIGTGHFRKDEMLAAGAANRAIIQDHLQQPSSVETARDALAFSNEAWEVNFMAAAVLKRGKQYDEAEDALLRNLDVRLEQRQSLSALMLLFHETRDEKKLSDLLARPDVVQTLPAMTLLQCLTTLSHEHRPAKALHKLESSVAADIDLSLGRDDVVFQFSRAWDVNNAKIQLHLAGREIENPYYQMHRNSQELRFRQIIELGTWLQQSKTPPSLILVVQNERSPELKFTFAAARPASNPGISTSFVAFLPGSRNLYQLESIQVGDSLVAFHSSAFPLKQQPIIPNKNDLRNLFSDPELDGDNKTPESKPESDEFAPLIPPPPTDRAPAPPQAETTITPNNQDPPVIEQQSFEEDDLTSDHETPNVKQQTFEEDHEVGKKSITGKINSIFKAKRLPPVPFRLMRKLRNRS